MRSTKAGSCYRFFYTERCLSLGVISQRKALFYRESVDEARESAIATNRKCIRYPRKTSLTYNGDNADYDENPQSQTVSSIGIKPFACEIHTNANRRRSRESLFAMFSSHRGFRLDLALCRPLDVDVLRPSEVLVAGQIFLGQRNASKWLGRLGVALFIQ